MVLFLDYFVNEGMTIIENLGRRNEESVDFIVRGIYPKNVKTSNLDMTHVKLELREKGISKYFNIFEEEGYEISSHCRLYLPINPLKKINLESVVVMGLRAPRRVEFSRKRMYD